MKINKVVLLGALIIGCGLYVSRASAAEAVEAFWTEAGKIWTAFPEPIQLTAQCFSIAAGARPFVGIGGGAAIAIGMLAASKVAPGFKEGLREDCKATFNATSGVGALFGVGNLAYNIFFAEQEQQPEVEMVTALNMMKKLNRQVKKVDQRVGGHEKEIAHLKLLLEKQVASNKPTDDKPTDNVTANFDTTQPVTDTQSSSAATTPVEGQKNDVASEAKAEVAENNDQLAASGS